MNSQERNFCACVVQSIFLSFFSFLFFTASCFFPDGWFDKQPLMSRLRRGREKARVKSHAHAESFHLLNKNKSEVSYFIKSLL